jgi:hypothetical protein
LFNLSIGCENAILIMGANATGIEHTVKGITPNLPQD